MTPEELRTLIDMGHPPLTTVTVAEIDGEDRTLLFGYTVDRDIFHVYLLDGRIHKHIYSHSKETLYHEARESWSGELLVPDKRVHPSPTDFSFARLLASRGVSISWTTWDPEVNWDSDLEKRVAERGAFYGVLHNAEAPTPEVPQEAGVGA